MTCMRPRWKGKEFSELAQANPMSGIIKQLQDYLRHSKTSVMLSGSEDILLESEAELSELLNRASFGQPISSVEKDKDWFQLGMDEGFYLSCALKCLTVNKEDDSPMSEEELWEYMKGKRSGFPLLYKAYSHLRTKNWVVRAGLQYGVDFVVYRHHPALVHSEYAVIVLLAGDCDASSSRLKVWSDWQCTLRVAGGVAKMLLVLSLDWKGSDMMSLRCLDKCIVEERVIRRWVPEQSREVNCNIGNGTQQ